MQTEPRGTMHGWIWLSNLLPFVQATADLVRSHPDKSELVAGVAESDADNDRWFTFVLDGPSPVEMRFARAGDQVLVDVELDGVDERFDIGVALLVDVCS